MRRIGYVVLGNKSSIGMSFSLFTVPFISFPGPDNCVIEHISCHASSQCSLRDQLDFLDHMFTLSSGILCKPFCAVLLFTRWTIQFLGSAIYSLYFSPLAKYPRPFCAKISSWPNSYHSLGGDRHIWLWQCHQIYGICSLLQIWQLF